MPFPSRLLAIILAGSILPALASTPDTATSAAATPPASATIAPGRWTADTLYDLLVAEVAGQRDRLDVALDAYLRQARERRDPELAERATRIAWYARDVQGVRDAATLWAELAPEDPEANANAIVALMQAGDIEAAIPFLDRVISAGRTAVRFDQIVKYAEGAEPSLRARIVVALNELSERHPRNARLVVARAQLAEFGGDLDGALALADTALGIDDRMASTWTLKGHLLSAAGRQAQSRRVLEKAAKRFPDDRDVRLAYLRALLDANDGDRARRELEDMTERWPDDGDLSLTLALTEWETGDSDGAIRRFTEIADSGYREDDAWMYAGRIAMAQEHWEQAAGFFQNVQGAQFIAAQVQVALAWRHLGRLADARRLLANLRQQRPEEAATLWLAESELLAQEGRKQDALALLDQALADAPENADLLYGHAMAAERVDRIDIAEADLRALLARHPDDPETLNALGYTLADRTDRAQEALGYVQRALQLKPDDAAIIDSMGWVLFRLGRLDEAIDYLRRALKATGGDPEVAAHLGEALWTNRQRREARKVWDRAEKQNPDSEPLKRTRERLEK